LQVPLGRVISRAHLDAELAQFDAIYAQAYRRRMLNKLGFEDLSLPEADELLTITLQFLKTAQIGYHSFFSDLTRQFAASWREDAEAIFPQMQPVDDEVKGLWNQWRILYFNVLLQLPVDEMERIQTRLPIHNPTTALLRPEIETVWQAIAEDDDWTGFYDLLHRLRV